MRFERRGYGGRGRFGGGGDFRPMPKPVRVGEEYDVEINEIGSKGDGIARIKNFVVFINGVKQGEKAHIKITEVRDRFAVGEKMGAASGKMEEAKEVKEEEVVEAKSETEETKMADEEEGEEGEGSEDESDEEEH